MEVGESGEKRPNFSAISSNNGPLIKLPTNSSSKPSDIRKLVIKNFKGKFPKAMKKKKQQSKIVRTSFGNNFGYRSSNRLSYTDRTQSRMQINFFYVLICDLRCNCVHFNAIVCGNAPILFYASIQNPLHYS